MLTLRWRVPENTVRTQWRVRNVRVAIDERTSNLPIATIIGPAGAGATARYIFNQISAAAQWIVNHNLGVVPSNVRVLSVGGVDLEADIVDVSVNQLVVSFAVPVAGRAIVS